MGGRVSSNGEVQQAIQALERRAQAILRARVAYRELVEFYLTVFRRQLEWSRRVEVHPQPVDADLRRACLRTGRPLVERFDPGIEPPSLLDLWTEMKSVFRRGNAVLRRALEKIDDAEAAGRFTPATWLSEQRPQRYELVTAASGEIGIDESILATLSRAVTFPHWNVVAQHWLDDGCAAEWRRASCPICGGPPGLAESCAAPDAPEGFTPAPQRRMHCPFCGAHWMVAALKCPACDSTRAGDAKYYYTAEEPELRIEFCKRCHRYVKVVNSAKTGGVFHLGLELLTTAHLDVIARDQHLRPLETAS